MNLRRLILQFFTAALVLFASARAGTYDEELRSLSGSLGASLEKAGLKTIAIGTIRTSDGNETALGKLLAEEMSVELVNQNQGVSVVDRANLGRIMEEHKLTEEGLIDPDNARKLKLEGIDAIILGTIIPFENAYRVSLKAIATESAKIVAATRGNIQETDSLNSLMGQSRPKPPAESLNLQSLAPSLSDPQPVAAPNVRPMKKAPVDFGRVSLALKSIAFNKKSGRAIVTFSVTDNLAGDSFCYRLVNKTDGGHDPRFAKRSSNKNLQFNPSDFVIDGNATDDKGNSYAIRMPSDAANITKLSKGNPIDFQLEFQAIPSGDGRIALPETLTFWFHFYAGHPSYFKADGEAFRFSVSDYPFDKVQ